MPRVGNDSNERLHLDEKLPSSQSTAPSAPEGSSAYTKSILAEFLKKKKNNLLTPVSQENIYTTDKHEVITSLPISFSQPEVNNSNEKFHPDEKSPYLQNSAHSAPRGDIYENFLLAYLNNQEQNLLTPASQEIESDNSRLTLLESIKNIEEFNAGSQDKKVIDNAIRGYFIIEKSGIHEEQKKYILCRMRMLVSAWLSQREVIYLNNSENIDKNTSQKISVEKKNIANNINFTNHLSISPSQLEGEKNGLTEAQKEAKNFQIIYKYLLHHSNSRPPNKDEENAFLELRDSNLKNTIIPQKKIFFMKCGVLSERNIF